MPSQSRQVLDLYSSQGIELISGAALQIYAIKQLGLSEYGIASFSLALYAFFSGIVEFGFNVSASREIPKSPQGSLHQLFVDVQLARTILLFISIVALALACQTTQHTAGNYSVVLTGCGYLLATAIGPGWWHIGNGRVETLARTVAVGRMLTSVITAAAISVSADHVTFLISQTLGLLLISMELMRRAATDMRVEQFADCSISFARIFCRVRRGSQYFASTIIYNAQRAAAPYLLGHALNPEDLGRILAADKILQVFSNLRLPFNQIFFRNSIWRDGGVSDVKRHLVVLVVVSCALSMVLAVSASTIATHLGYVNDGRLTVAIKVLGVCIPAHFAYSYAASVYGPARNLDASILKAQYTATCAYIATIYLIPARATIEEIVWTIVGAEYLVVAIVVLVLWRHSHR